MRASKSLIIGLNFPVEFLAFGSNAAESAHFEDDFMAHAKQLTAGKISNAR